MDFDTWEGAHTFADRIALRTADEQSPMPPGGGPSPTEQAAIQQWADCDAPGPASQPAACSTRVEFQGDITESSGLCTAGSQSNTVTGSVHIAANNAEALDCLCEIDGDLLIDGATSAVVLPALTRVGGAIEVRAQGLSTLLLPELAFAGEVRLLDAAIDTLDLDKLESVEGLFLVSGGRLPETFSPARLQSVGSHFGLSGAGGVVLIDLPRLEMVGGDMIFEAMPSLYSIAHTSDLETLDGSLRILDNPSLSAVEDFGFLLNIFGDVEIGGNQVSVIDALWTLRRIDGELIIRDEPALERISGFTHLEIVTGAIRLQNTAVSVVDGFDALDEVGGFELADNLSLESIANGSPTSLLGDVRAMNNPLLSEIPWLASVSTLTGSLELTDLPSITSVNGLSSLAVVEGDLTLSRNAALLDLGTTGIEQIVGSLTLEDDAVLSSLAGLDQLETIGGDLVLRSLPQLPSEQVQQLVETVTVGGTSTIEP